MILHAIATEAVIDANPVVVIGGALVTGMCSIAVTALQLNSKKTADRRHEENRSVLSEIRSDVGEVKSDVHEIRAKQSDHGERIARLEERTRTYPSSGGNPFGPPGGQA